MASYLQTPYSGETIPEETLVLLVSSLSPMLSRVGGTPPALRRRGTIVPYGTPGQDGHVGLWEGWVTPNISPPSGA